MNGSNKLRAFAEVMTLHAWQQAGSQPGLWEIYADVSFNTARVGADPDVPIRFKLSLKRAEISLVLPESDEALSLDPQSVARDDGGIGRNQIKITKEESKQRQRSGEMGVVLEAAIKTLKGLFSAKASKSQSQSAKTSQEITQDRFLIKVTGNAVGSGKATWNVEAQEADRLHEEPWDAKKPRAVVRDSNHETRRQGMEAGGIRFQVVCAREDLLIEDIQFKDPDDAKKLKRSEQKAALDAALTQYILDEIRSNGLWASNIADPYGKMLVLDRLIESVDVRTVQGDT